MALKNLFAVTLLLGGVLAVGCGGTSGRVAQDTGEDQPPNNTDQPPINPDQPSSGEDRAPSSSDRPPSNPDSPSGGRLQELCNKLCELVERCDTGANMGGMEAEFCEEGTCRIPAGAETEVPCLDETIEVLDCALSLSNFCSLGDSPRDEEFPQQCRDAAAGFESCNDYEPPGTDGPGPGEGNCTVGGGCDNCPDDCAECLCEATGNQAGTTECLTSSVCTDM